MTFRSSYHASSFDYGLQSLPCFYPYNYVLGLVFLVVENCVHFALELKVRPAVLIVGHPTRRIYPVSSAFAAMMKCE